MNVIGQDKRERERERERERTNVKYFIKISSVKYLSAAYI